MTDLIHLESLISALFVARRRIEHLPESSKLIGRVTFDPSEDSFLVTFKDSEKVVRVEYVSAAEILRHKSHERKQLS